MSKDKQRREARKPKKSKTAAATVTPAIRLTPPSRPGHAAPSDSEK